MTSYNQTTVEKLFIVKTYSYINNLVIAFSVSFIFHMTLTNKY